MPRPEGEAREYYVPSSAFGIKSNAEFLAAMQKMG